MKVLRIARRVMCALIVLGAPAFGQQKETPAPTIKRRAELVLVPAVVTQDGKPVRGLTAKDFVLLHNGQPEQVAEFEEIEAIPAKVEPLDLPLRTVQNYVPADSHQDVVILLLDYLNANPYTVSQFRLRLNLMVQQFTTSHTPVTLLILSYKGLISVHTYSSDPENISMAVAKWSSEEPPKKAITSNPIPERVSLIAPTEAAYTALALRQFTVLAGEWSRDSAYASGDNLKRAITLRAMNLRAIEQLSEAFRGIPGRKKLIWMWNDFPDHALRAAGQKTVPPLEGAYLRAWKSLSDANIVVYPIPAHALVTRGRGMMDETLLRFSAHGSSDLVYCNDQISPIWTSVEVSKDGNICDDWPEECLQRMLADTHYYLLGFYLRGDNKPGWHNLQVKVNQPKITVRARPGFAVGGDAASPNLEKIEKDVLATASVNDDAVAVALSSPLDYTSIPLRLQWTALNTPGNETQVELVVSSPPGGIAVNPDDMSLNVDFLAFFKPVGAKEGQPFPSWLSTVLNPEQQKSFATAGFRFRRQVTLAPGRYEVRVLLRDNVARKMGTVSTIIELPATSAFVPSEIKH
jgi:VWFA-related protein